jgi:uncharacterized protein
MEPSAVKIEGGPLPTPDRDSRPYWAALADGRLELQQCQDCGHWTWPPRPICSHCHGFDLEWRPVRGTGTVASWITAHHAYMPSLAPFVPYTVVLVQLDEQHDIFIPGMFHGDGEVRQGLEVTAAPARQTDDVGLLFWRAA